MEEGHFYGSEYEFAETSHTSHHHCSRLSFRNCCSTSGGNSAGFSSDLGIGMEADEDFVGGCCCKRGEEDGCS